MTKVLGTVLGMNMRNRFFAALAAVTLVAPSANAETYVCQIRSIGPGMGLVSDTIAISIDDVTSNVMVSDAIILATNKRPIAAVLTVNTPKRLAVKWGVQAVKGSRNKTFEKVDYKLRIWKSRGNQASLTAKFARKIGSHLGHDVNGSGRCTLR